MKRMLLCLLGAAMLLSGIPEVEATAAFRVNCPKDVNLTWTKTPVCGDDGFNAAFVLENQGDSSELWIRLEAFGESGAVLAASEARRRLESGQTTPFSMMAEGLAGNVTQFAVNVSRDAAPGPEPELQTKIYVSPSGSDQAPGTEQRPVQSLAGAVELVREKNRDQAYAGQSLIIELTKGRYRVEQPVSVAQADISNLSGLWIVGADAELCGGVGVTGADFTKVTDKGVLDMFPKSVQGKLYSLNLSDYGVKLDFSQGSGSQDGENDPIYTTLYDRNRTQQMARYPDAEQEYAVGTARIGKDEENRKTCVKSAQVKTWKNLEEAWLRGWLMYDWDLVRGKVSAVENANPNDDIDSNISGKVVTLQRLFCGSLPDNSARPITSKNKPWYVYNLPDELNTEGEYVIRNNVLYYYPREGEVADGSFAKAELSLNVGTSDLLKIDAKTRVTVENIVFTSRRGYLLSGSADNLTVRNCRFQNGMDAVRINGNDNTIQDCVFYNLGGSGAIIGGGDRDNLIRSGSVIENCWFEKNAQINRTNCAPLSLEGCGVTARKNTITYAPHLALSYTGNDHIIEYNEITNCLTDKSTDAGLIYTGKDLSNLGTVIRCNYFHDSECGLGAIYYDDWLSGQITEGNVFEGMERALMINGGVENVFQNNIVIGADSGVNVRQKGRMIAVNGQRYNAWDEIGGRYNAYANVFMGMLEGIPESGGRMPGVKWKEQPWQIAYGKVLGYVNNKKDDKASNTTATDNYFVSTTKALNPFDGMSRADLVLSGNVENAQALTLERQKQYEDVVKNSGASAGK